MANQNTFTSLIIEISGDGDIELLDYAVRKLPLGDGVIRNFRLLNIRRFENTIFRFSRGGEGASFQPFKASFYRNQAGNYLVHAESQRYADHIVRMAKQLGFTVISCTGGDGARSPMNAAQFTYSVNLNGRSATFDLSSPEDDALVESAEAVAH